MFYDQSQVRFYHWSFCDLNVNPSSFLQQTTVKFMLTGSLTQAMRNFAKSLEGWLKNAMAGVPDEMVKHKVNKFIFIVLQSTD